MRNVNLLDFLFIFFPQDRKPVYLPQSSIFLYFSEFASATGLTQVKSGD